MADQGSSGFLLPVVAYVPPPRVTKVSVTACPDFHLNLVPTELLDPNSLEGRLAQARINGRKCRGRTRAITLLRYIKPALLPILEDNGTMINAKNLCDLLSENVDAAVTDWIVFTAHGTLIGSSDVTTIKQARKLAALVGAEWRIQNNITVSGSKEANGSSHFLAHVESISYEQATDGVRCMHGEANGMMIAVHHIKGRLLVAAMIPLDESESPPADKIAERMESLQIFEAEDVASVAVNQKAPNDDGGPMKRDILMLKAEGMVDVLREELSDFTVPEKFY